MTQNNGPPYASGPSGRGRALDATGPSPPPGPGRGGVLDAIGPPPPLSARQGRTDHPPRAGSWAARCAARKGAADLWIPTHMRATDPFPGVHKDPPQGSTRTPMDPAVRATAYLPQSGRHSIRAGASAPRDWPILSACGAKELGQRGPEICVCGPLWTPNGPFWRTWQTRHSPEIGPIFYCRKGFRLATPTGFEPVLPTLKVDSFVSVCSSKANADDGKRGIGRVQGERSQT